MKPVQHRIGIDTETGGLYPSQHALLSIGAACTWGKEPFLIYITPESQPGKTVEHQAAVKNGYTPELWEMRGAKPLDVAMRWFIEWLSVRMAEQELKCLVCHNIGFDKGFLEEACRVTSKALPGRHEWRCSCAKFGELMDDGLVERGSGSLDRLGVISGFWKEGQRPTAHDALQDAMACLHGYNWLLHQEPTMKLVREMGDEIHKQDDLLMQVWNHLNFGLNQPFVPDHLGQALAKALGIREWKGAPVV